MAKKPNKSAAAPKKVCPACGQKVPVRSKACTCGFDFASSLPARVELPEPAVEAMLTAVRLVTQLGEEESLRIVRRIAAELKPKP